MRSILKLRLPFSSKKLGIADTAKVIQDKIMNITQVVNIQIIHRMMSKNLVLSLVSVMVLLELLDLIKFKLVKWSSLDLESEVWLLTCKLIMSVLSSSVMTGNISIYFR